MIGLPNLSELAPTGPADQSALSMLSRGSNGRVVSTADRTTQNGSDPYQIGTSSRTDLSWDSQREMHAELSSSERAQAENPIIFLTGSLSASASTGDLESAVTGSNSASVKAGSALLMAVGNVKASTGKDSPVQSTLPSASRTVLSILNLQGGSVRQAELPVGIPTPPAPLVSESAAFSVANRGTFSEAWLSSSTTAALSEDAFSRGTSSQQSDTVSLPSNDALADSPPIAPAANAEAPPTSARDLPTGSAIIQSGGSCEAPAEAGNGRQVPTLSSTGTGVGRLRKPTGSPAGPASTEKPSAGTAANEAASPLSFLPTVSLTETSPGAASAQGDSPGGDQLSLRSAGLTINPVKPASPLGGSATSAPPSKNVTDLPTLPATAGSGAGLPKPDAAVQNPVDQLSFEFTLQPQSSLGFGKPELTTSTAQKGNSADGTGLDATGLDEAAKIALQHTAGPPRAASVALGSDAGHSPSAGGGPVQPDPRRTIDAAPESFTHPLDQSAGSVAALASSAPAQTPPLASQTTGKPEAPADGRSTGSAIVLPEPKAATQSGLVHDVQLRVQGEAGENVTVRLSDRSGEVQITVRSTDQATATTLRQNLSTLSASLEKQGWKTDLADSPVDASAPGLRDPSGQQQADQERHQQSSPPWQEPPERKRHSPAEQWTEIDQQET